MVRQLIRGVGEAGRETGELQYAGRRSQRALFGYMAEQVWGRDDYISPGLRLQRQSMTKHESGEAVEVVRQRTTTTAQPFTMGRRGLRPRGRPGPESRWSLHWLLSACKDKGLQDLSTEAVDWTHRRISVFADDGND